MMYQRYTGHLANNPEINCFTSSAQNTVNGMLPMTEVFPEWSLNTFSSYQYMHGFNMTSDQLENSRQVIIDIQKNNKKLNTYLTDSHMVTAEQLHSNGIGRVEFLDNVDTLLNLAK